jgi:hypothetical protein
MSCSCTLSSRRVCGLVFVTGVTGGLLTAGSLASYQPCPRVERRVRLPGADSVEKCGGGWQRDEDECVVAGVGGKMLESGGGSRWGV